MWIIGRAESDCGIDQNAVQLLGCPLIGDGKGRTLEEARWNPEVSGGGKFSETFGYLKYPFCMQQGERGQGPVPRLDNLLVSAVSRHSLDRLNTSNDFQKRGGGW